MFFSFDGVDGSGKSTQIVLFESWLRELGRDVVTCRDPGSTPLGERIREIVLHSPADTPIDARAEMLLYMAARAQLVEEVIRPSLDAGAIVIADRYLLANIVYQGHAGGVDVETIREVGRVATSGVLPDCVFVLDLPPDAARARMGRELDRMEDRGAAFQQRLRDGFLAEAARPEHNATVIDATGSVESIHAAIRAAAEPLLSRRG